ncbi:MAG: ribonuclease Z [Nanoarchaeota archaeon]|nr:ribonuclease Z [Nanoarchaeota archaeon]
MEVVLLGTSSMVPTKERNHFASLISYRDEKILIDCGEGTQRQIRKAGISPMKITRILISHWHGDHILGLPGLLQTIAQQDYNKEIMIYGPKGTKKNFDNMFNFFIAHDKLKYKVIEIEEGKFFDNKYFELVAMPLEHGTKTLGYALIEKDKKKIIMSYVRKQGLKEGPIMKRLQEGKDITHNGKKILASKATVKVLGKKIVFITDTVMCNNTVKLAKNADLLFCEATFIEEEKNKAKEFLHLTAKQAATIAKKAKAQKLVLYHFSQRYKNVKAHVEEAKKVFNNVTAGEDLEEFEL